MGWAAKFRKDIGLVVPRGKYKKRHTCSVSPKASSAAKGITFSRRLRRIIREKNINPSLAFNVDQIQLSLTSGLKQSDHINHITLLVGITMTGMLLPIQIIFAGLDETCLPKYKLPNKWCITYSKAAKADSETMKLYFEDILFPFMKKQKKSMINTESHNSLLILDKHGPHTTFGLNKILHQENVYKVEIPGGLTKILQPVDKDQYIIKYIKSKVEMKYTDYYCNITRAVLTKHSSNEKLTDLQISEVKELTMKWIETIIAGLSKNKTKLKALWDHISHLFSTKIIHNK